MEKDDLYLAICVTALEMKNFLVESLLDPSLVQIVNDSVLAISLSEED